MGHPTRSRQAWNELRKWRAPADAPNAVLEAYGRTWDELERIAHSPKRQDQVRLQAIVRMRDEVAGAPTRRSEIAGVGGAGMAVSISIGVPAPSITVPSRAHALPQASADTEQSSTTLSLQSQGAQQLEQAHPTPTPVPPKRRRASGSLPIASRTPSAVDPEKKP